MLSLGACVCTYTEACIRAPYSRNIQSLLMMKDRDTVWGRSLQQGLDLLAQSAAAHAAVAMHSRPGASALEVNCVCRRRTAPC